MLIAAALEATGIVLGTGTDKWNYSRTLLPLATFASSQTEVGEAAAFALSRFRGDSWMPLPSLLPVTMVTSATGKRRAWLLRALARYKDATLSALYIQTITLSPDLNSQIEAAKALSGNPITDQELVKSWMMALPTLPTPVLVESLISIGALGSEGAPLTEHVLKGLNHSSTWVRSQTLKTLARINPPEARKQIDLILKMPDHACTGAAVISLAISVSITGENQKSRLCLL